MNNGYEYNTNTQYQNFGQTSDFNTQRNNADTLKLLGRCAGLSLICYICLSNILNLLVLIPAVKELYYSDYLFKYSFSIIVAVVSILLPFLFAGKFEKRRMPEVELFPLGKPEKPSLVFLAAPIGLAVCLVGNYLTGILQSFLSNAGVQLSSPSLSQPDDVFGMIVYCTYVTVGTALIEETVMRGVVMQPLRKFGNGFAIVVTAIVFGMMHCNLIQAPFAFIAGLAMGYFAVATESLWTSILIHFLNNSYSIISAKLFDILPQREYVLVYYICTAIVLVIAIICLVIFLRVRGSFSLPKREKIVPYGKAGLYFGNVPMIIAIIMILLITSRYVGMF